MGYRHTLRGEFQESLRHYKRAYNLDLNEDDEMGYAFIMTGNVYRSLAIYDSAKYYYDKGISVLTNLTRSHHLAYAYKSLARLFAIQWKSGEVYLVNRKLIADDIKRASRDLVAWRGNKITPMIPQNLSAQRFDMAQESGEEFLRLCTVAGGLLFASESIKSP